MITCRLSCKTCVYNVHLLIILKREGVADGKRKSIPKKLMNELKSTFFSIDWDTRLFAQQDMIAICNLLNDKFFDLIN